MEEPELKDFKLVSHTSISLGSGVLGELQERITNRGLQHIYQQLEATERLENFRRVARGETGTYVGYRFNDSDVYKWIEACAYTLAHSPDHPIRAAMDSAIGLIADAQEPSGYINTYVSLQHPGMQYRNLHMNHELYCGGHMLEAAVAVAQINPDSLLLTVARKYVDHLMTDFDPKTPKYCGHPELELALVRFSELENSPAILAFARAMIEARGKHPTALELEMLDEAAVAIMDGRWLYRNADGSYNGEYGLDHRQLRTQDRPVGHAVRATYLYAAANRAWTMDQDPEMHASLDNLWRALVDQQMYVTGGIGQSHDNEGFADEFFLPNDAAYAETCAAIGFALWAAERMGQLDSEAIEIFERLAHNAIPAGYGSDGTSFFYTNPLANDGSHRREPFFGCACCPPNVARFYGRIGDYLVATNDDEVALLMPHSLVVKSADLNFEVSTDAPFTGQWTIRWNSSSTRRLRVRIPSWLDLEWSRIPDRIEGEWAIFEGPFVAGESWVANVTPRLTTIHPDPRNPFTKDQVAIAYGPFILCRENPGGTLSDSKMTTSPTVEKHPTQFGEPVVISGQPDRWIPYATWANAEPGEMAVYIEKG